MRSRTASPSPGSRPDLEIERTRLGERLSYALKIAPGLTGWAIPPLAIQALVENSVKHAVAPRPV